MVTFDRCQPDESKSSFSPKESLQGSDSLESENNANSNSMSSSSHGQGVSSGESSGVVGHEVHVPVRKLEGGGGNLLDRGGKSEACSCKAEASRGDHDLHCIMGLIRGLLPLVGGCSPDALSPGWSMNQ